MVIIIIRHFVRPHKVDAFLEAYRKQTPINDPAFRGETLARASDRSSLPASLRRLVSDESGGITVINIAKWDSWSAFATHFAEEIAKEDIGAFDREIKTAPSQRILLDVVEDHPKIDL